MTQRVVLAYPGGLDTSVAAFDQPAATDMWK